MSEELWDLMETYLEYVWVDFTQRSIKILSDDGHEETINWKWDEEGAEGFAHTVSMIQETVEPERRHYLL